MEENFSKSKELEVAIKAANADLNAALERKLGMSIQAALAIKA